MVEIFKTNITDETVAANIIALLHNRLPACDINFDLADCDNILRVKGDNFCVTTIIEFLNTYGFSCSVLN